MPLPSRARQAAQIIERGKAAGVVRPDCETQDFGLLQTMVSAVMEASAEVEPDLWRRYFTIALQGYDPWAHRSSRSRCRRSR